jgi:mannose-6-phosphate isomerase-like protein (cupin superfamily)
MTRLLVVLALSAVAGIASAEEADGFGSWSAKDLQETEKTLIATKKDPASQVLGNYGNHALQLAHRESDGKAEVHERKHDVFVVQSGEARLLTGGTVIDDKPGNNGEHTGTGIKDGKETILRTGDVVHIPAGMPHQLLIKKGDTFTYFVVKVEVPAAAPVAAPAK